jgi:hypothetical protein
MAAGCPIGCGPDATTFSALAKLLTARILRVGPQEETAIWRTAHVIATFVLFSSVVSASTASR